MRWGRSRGICEGDKCSYALVVQINAGACLHIVCFADGCVVQPAPSTVHESSPDVVVVVALDVWKGECGRERGASVQGGAEAAAINTRLIIFFSFALRGGSHTRKKK